MTLVYFGLQQIKSNQLIEYQKDAINFIQTLNRDLTKRRLLTNSLPADSFNYYREIYNPVTKQPQRSLSPLSELSFNQPKISQQVKGLVGFFQFNEQGVFNSPIWPLNIDSKLFEESSIASIDGEIPPELQQRKRVLLDIYHLISKSESIQKIVNNELVDNKILFDVIFDLPEHFIFYRVISYAEQKLLQGYVVERDGYFSQLIIKLLQESYFDTSILVTLDNKILPEQPKHFLYQNLPIGTNANQILLSETHQQQNIYRTTLDWPYKDFSLTLSTDHFPIPPAMIYSSTFAAILMVTVLLSCFGFYRLGLKHLLLAEQRLNFVASVSHELKTPLTSIRMYSEMLIQGNVISERHRQDYYAFIFGESERLSRLINNILQLSQLSNQHQKLNSEYTQLKLLCDIIRSKTSSIIDEHDFRQRILLRTETTDNILVLIDLDAFSQIIINITDNAIKFFDKDKIANPHRQQVDFIFRPHPKQNAMLQLEIRDYGDGISRGQEAKILELFYREGDELTRRAPGTGIGLALVKELVVALGGEITVENREPGLAIVISFQIKKDSALLLLTD
jgi:nitrogen-specific signal transduction histidine kinase